MKYYAVIDTNVLVSALLSNYANAATVQLVGRLIAGEIVPVIITAYEDKSYDFVLKTTPATFKLKEAAKINKGSATPNSVKVGKVTKEQIKAIAEYKMPDLNAANLDSAMSMIAGSCRSMGVVVEGWNEKK